jgi:hypothetical protein
MRGRTAVRRDGAFMVYPYHVGSYGRLSCQARLRLLGLRFTVHRWRRQVDLRIANRRSSGSASCSGALRADRVIVSETCARKLVGETQGGPRGTTTSINESSASSPHPTWEERRASRALDVANRLRDQTSQRPAVDARLRTSPRRTPMRSTSSRRASSRFVTSSA